MGRISLGAERAVQGRCVAGYRRPGGGARKTKWRRTGWAGDGSRPSDSEGRLKPRQQRRKASQTAGGFNCNSKQQRQQQQRARGDRLVEIEMSTYIAAPRERVFDLARSIDVHQRSLEHTRERAVGGRTSGLIGLGETVTWRARHL